MFKDIVANLYPLHRTLVADGLDEGLEVVRRHFPEAMDYRVEEYACGSERWTWKVPSRYTVREAYIALESGERVVDVAENYLHLVSYSRPVDCTLSWDELKDHLHFSPKRPDAIPWVFKYYDQTWGFCLPRTAYDRLPRDGRYRVVIRSEFRDAPGLKVGVGLALPEGGATVGSGEILVSAHICHPLQANDNASGVAVAIGVAQRLSDNPLPPGSAAVRFLFPPETVGTVCYLSAHEELIPSFRAGIVCESIGNANSLAIQHSWPGGALVDRVADYVLQRRVPDHRSFPAWELFSADEKVINGPGVNVSTVMFTRAPYAEYHTSEDNLGVVDESSLRESVDVIEETIRILATDYSPKRTFRGPLQLSRHGLWIDYHGDKALSRAFQKAMLYFEGSHTVFDIAEALGVDYWTMRDLVERYRSKAFVVSRSMPDRNSESGLP